MPVKKKGKCRINVLEDITIKASGNDPYIFISSEQNYNYLTPQDDADKENINTDYTIVDIENNSGRQRCTASMYFFDEEPVFSDSEDEREHNKNILKSQNFMIISNEPPKKVDVEVQCNLLPHTTELLELVKRCAGFNPDDFNGEFRELVQLCSLLNYKCQYDTPPSSVGERNTSINDDNVEMNLKTQTPNLENSRSNTLPEFVPSSEGSNGFLSEVFIFGNGKFNEVTENKVNFPRRSSRVRKSSQLNRSRLVIGKDRLQKSRKNVGKNVRHHAGIDRKNSPISLCKNTRKRKRERKKVEDIMLDYILGSKSRKANGQLLANLKRKGYLDNLTDDIHVKIALPKKQVRSLARNWMNPHKNLINPDYSAKFENTLLRQRARRLYSPTKWLRSKDFANLCEKV